MKIKNNIILEGVEKDISYQELFRKNEYLIDENKKLHQDNEKLREIFRIATIEFEKKNQEIKVLQEELEKSHEKIKVLEEENAFLKEELEKEKGKVNLLNQMTFGQRNEKKHTDVVQHKSRGARAGHKGQGRKAPENLPTKEQIIELPQQEQVCPYCGLPCQETEIEKQASEIEVESRYYYVKKYRRKIYKKTCKRPHTLVVAPLLDKLIPKSKLQIFGLIFLSINIKTICL